MIVHLLKRTTFLRDGLDMKGKFSHLNTEVICSFSHISEARKAKRHICKSREGQGLKMDGRCVYKHKYTITTEDI